jgi:hypothetical protein
MSARVASWAFDAPTSLPDAKQLAAIMHWTGMADVGQSV